MLNTHHVLTPEFTKVIFSCLRISKKKTDWDYYFSGFYVEFTPVGLLLPDDGWKLRVNTATLGEAVQALKAVVPICADRQLAFKVLGDPDIYIYAHSKQMEASSAGKFLTCYLPTETELVEVVHLFEQAISQEGLSPAAHAISDQRLSENLAYRYGSFTADPFVRGIPDCRDYFKLPPGIIDPFTGKGQETEADASGGVVIGNYHIETLLHRTYASAVYRGTRLGELEKQSIILKEARPHAIVDGIAATTRLENEYTILKVIANMDCAGICPTPLEFFAVDGYRFLAMTEIDAVSLYEWMQQQKKRQREYLWIGIKVAELILELHAHRISWNDLHPSNLLINEATQKLYLIDAEFAMMPACGKDFTMDLQTLGKLLLWLAFNGEEDGLLEHDGCPDIFLEKLKQGGNDRDGYCAAIDIALSPETVDVLPILKMLTRKHSCA